MLLDFEIITEGHSQHTVKCLMTSSSCLLVAPRPGLRGYYPARCLGHFNTLFRDWFLFLPWPSTSSCPLMGVEPALWKYFPEERVTTITNEIYLDFREDRISLTSSYF